MSPLATTTLNTQDIIQGRLLINQGLVDARTLQLFMSTPATGQQDLCERLVQRIIISPQTAQRVRRQAQLEAENKEPRPATNRTQVFSTGPRRLADYQVLETLSWRAGSSSSRAVHRLYGSEVLIKRMTVDGLDNAGRCQLIRRLLKAYKDPEFQSPTLLSLDFQGPKLCVVREFLAAPSLKQAYKHQQLSWNACLRAIHSAAAIVQRAHTQGFVHGHVSAENIFVDEFKNVFISDFQCLDGHRQNRRADILAFGRLLQGLKPNQAQGRAVSAIIRRCFGTQDHAYESLAELLVDLESLLKGHEIAPKRAFAQLKKRVFQWLKRPWRQGKAKLASFPIQTDTNARSCSRRLHP